jgi:RNA polymerase sigma-B factor
MPAVSVCAPASRDVVEQAGAGQELDTTIGVLVERCLQRPAERVRLREQMIEAGLPFAVRLARHYQGRGEPFEDLVQVATVGLIKAIDGYDPERGPFSHYAGPTVRGELKKHFRDRGWSVRVPRRLQELKLEMSRAHQALTHQLGHAPSVAELAKHLGVDEEHVIEGLDLAHAYHPVSLDAPVSGQEDASDLGEMVGHPDPAVESIGDRMTLAWLLPQLPEREQRILHMRFSGNLTQSQIAAEIGISQMHVSRLLAQTLAWLREAMSGDAVPAWPGLGAPHPVPEPGGLNIELRRLAGGTVLVVVSGEVDHDTAPGLRTALCETAIADRPRLVRTDLAQVPLMDAAGAGALAAGYRAALHSGAQFQVERPRRPVAEMLRNAGLAAVFGCGPPPARGAAPTRVTLRPAVPAGAPVPARPVAVPAAAGVGAHGMAAASTAQTTLPR